MTREDIIRMAEQAGIEYNYVALGMFAALVAATEREACAKVCEDISNGSVNAWQAGGAGFCAAAIRKRGEAKP